MSRQIYSGGRVHVMAEQCETCVFRPGNLMHLRPGRLAGMVKEGPFACHHTIHGQAEQEAICRGYWDRHRNDTMELRMAQHLDVIEEVAPDA